MVWGDCRIKPDNDTGVMMTNEKIKEMLLDILPCEIDFTVIQTGKESIMKTRFWLLAVDCWLLASFLWAW